MADAAGRKERFEWVHIGQGDGLMMAARRRLGKSREAVAREIGVSLKTYERYETAGKVPVHRLDVVAKALGLEVVEHHSPAKVTLSKRDEDRIAAVERIARETRDEVMALRQEVASTLRAVLRYAQGRHKSRE